MIRFFLFLGCMLAMKTGAKAQTTEVFQNGEAGYACFRIPALVTAPNGWLLAFAEGRKKDCADFGDVDIVLKISKNNGRKWSKLRVVAENDSLQAGNPAPVFDLTDPLYPEGRLMLCYNTGTAPEQDVRKGNGVREVFWIASTDCGRHWSPPVNITLQVHRPNHPARDTAYRYEEDWRSYANTPGHAVQLSGGRIFVPANHSAGSPRQGYLDYQSHAFYTDDHGQTWSLTATVAYPGSNEATAAQMPDGTLWMNMRDQSGRSKARILAKSKDGGLHWEAPGPEAALPDPVCQGSMLAAPDASGQTVLYFSNPNSDTRREHLGIRFWSETAPEWRKLCEVYAGSAAYSDLTLLKKGGLGILFEADQYSRILFSAVPLQPGTGDRKRHK